MCFGPVDPLLRTGFRCIRWHVSPGFCARRDVTNYKNKPCKRRGQRVEIMGLTCPSSQLRSGYDRAEPQRHLPLWQLTAASPGSRVKARELTCLAALKPATISQLLSRCPFVTAGLFPTDRYLHEVQVVCSQYCADVRLCFSSLPVMSASDIKQWRVTAVTCRVSMANRITWPSHIYSSVEAGIPLCFPLWPFLLF